MFHLIVLKCVLILFVTVFSNVTAQTPCPFNENCTCTTGLYVYCNWSTPEFPHFTQYNSTIIIQITINIQATGNVSLIPSRAFYALQSLGLYSTIYFSGQCTPVAPVIISSGAFNIFQQTGLGAVYFVNVYMPVLKSAGFANSNISNLYFKGNTICIEIIEEYAFDGLSMNTLIFNTTDDNVKIKLGPFSLYGINFFGTSSTIYFNNIIFNNVTTFKQVKSNSLGVIGNSALTYIPDFAFCNCNALFQCKNGNLQSITLISNNISSISNNAFANLPSLSVVDLGINSITVINELVFANITFLSYLSLSGNRLKTLPPILPSFITSLYLSWNQFTDIPVSTINQLKYLQNFYIDDNNIKNIAPNSFHNLSNLTFVDFNANPIINIEPGALNGVILMTELEFQSLNELITVDLLITYGMSSLEYVIFDSCLNLEGVYLSDVAKLPMKLNNIQLSNLNNLQQIDSNFGQWLQQSKSNILSLYENSNFLCAADIQWMAVYTICYNQITSINTNCQDGTSLIDYLKTFNPVC